MAATDKSLQSQSGFQLFQTGKAAMTIVGHWFYDAFASTKGLHFDIAPLPIGPMGGSHSATNMGGNGVSLSKQTKYPDEAWKCTSRSLYRGCLGVRLEHFCSNRSFAHLCLGDPSRGSTGVHEQGYNPITRSPLRTGIIPTITFVEDTLQLAAEQVMEGIADAQAYAETYLTQVKESLRP